MKQLLLDLAAEKPQTLHAFVAGKNEELLQLLHGLTRHRAAGLERFIYLWGEPGAGKSHLLHAMAMSSETRHIPAEAAAGAFEFDNNITLYLLDDCDKLSPQSQIAAFNLFNRIRENDAILISSGSRAPAALPLREDLRTRLGWGLIYQVHGLTDDEKIAALNQAALARGLQLSPGVVPYLVRHFERDMRSLSAMLDALDTYSLETKRPITLPLLRELLQTKNK
jgi:DnaA-homolog protein